MKNSNKKRGFTIVELIIVIAVIAILAAVLIPTFSSLINKSLVAADESLVRNLNEALAMDVTNPHNTMTDALKATKENGFDVSKINARASTDGQKHEILWDSRNDCFVYEKGGEINYIPKSNTKGDATPVELWHIANDGTLSEKYSNYLAAGTYAATVDITTGLDVGEHKEVTKVNYTNPNGKQDVVIRTNGGNLTVNSGSVVHYGVARYLTLDSSATYTEKGSIVANITDFEQKTEESGWTVVKTENELKDALERNVEKIMLGANITTVNDITDGTPDTFTVNSNVEINLNGYNITGVHTNNVDTLNKNNVLINVNNATLTLSGYGVISLKYEGTNMQWNALSATLRLSGSTGTINVNDAVVVDHLGGTAMSYAIDCYASGNANTLNVNGGALNSTYIAIRWFYPNADSTGKLNINAGIITGANRDIWTQGSTADNSAIVKIADSYKVKVNGDSYYLD